MAQETNARPFERVHFIGIGGAGMSGIALVLHQRGFHVTGSDLKASKYTRALVKEGIEVFVGHHARTIDEVKPDVVVISTAIPQSNPELVRARELGIEVWHRAKMLSFLSGDAITIACAGTHGKTTTSSLAATMLERMNLKPTFLIGGIIDGYETNGNSGEGPYFVAEADESDGSFLNLDPNVVIVTNIEADHLDHYGSLEAIEKTFVQFMGSVPEDGHVIVCGENPHVPELARSCGRPVLTYGFGEGNDVVCTPKEGEGVNAFSVRLPDGHEYNLHLDHNPGLHNCLNATAVLTLAYVLGLPCDEAAQAISSFAGVHRRFELVGEVSAASSRSGVYNPEGAQYQLFSDLGGQWEGTNEAFMVSGECANWWLRSPDPANEGLIIAPRNSDGSPGLARNSAIDGEVGVVPAFCL